MSAPAPAGVDAEGRPVVRTVHTTEVSAPAATVYGLLAGAQQWPAVFEPTVFLELLEPPPDDERRARPGVALERFRLWATVNGQVVSWSSRRELDSEAGLISFRQEHSTPPIASMSGSWQVAQTAPGRSLVTLVHDFSTVDGQQRSHEWIASALDRNSTAELGQLRRLAELDARFDARGALTDTFEDSVTVDAPPGVVYEFIARGDLWAQRIPHVGRSVMTVEQDGVQRLELTTTTPDGARHETSSTRVRLEGSRIAYKQHKTPEILLGHAGLWTFASRAGGAKTLATSRHTFALDPEAIERVTGPGIVVEAERARVREALRGNSLATLEHAAKFAG